MKLIRSRTIALVIVLLLSTATLSAQKVVVGVTGIETAAQNIACEGLDRATGADCNQALSSGFMSMLETAIVKTGKMDVMERGRMNSVLSEQLIAQIGLTNSGGRIGGLTGVDYLIYGTVTKFGAKQSGLNVSSGKGVGSLLTGRARQGLGGGIQTSSSIVEMAVDLRVTDVATGSIVIADSVEGEIKSGSGFSVGGIQSSDTSADPFADVQRVVAALISEKIVTNRFPVKVIQVQSDGTLILNYGNVFFAPGDQLMLFEVGETFVDPDTGEVLGSEETELGRVQITESEARFSKARIVGAPFDVSVGSILKRPVVPVQTDEGNERRRSGRKIPG